jgi:hypothetical protein
MLQSIFYCLFQIASLQIDSSSIIEHSLSLDVITAEHNILRYLFYIHITIVDNHPTTEVDN